MAEANPADSPCCRRKRLLPESDSSESPSPKKNKNNPKQENKQTVEIDVRMCQELYDKVGDVSKLLLWNGQRKRWRYVRQDNSKLELKIKEYVQNIDIPRNQLVENKRDMIRRRTTDVLNQFEWNGELRKWTTTSPLDQLDKVQQYVAFGFRNQFGNGPGRVCWDHIFGEDLFPGLFSFNIGGNSPLNDLQRKIAACVQCYDSDRDSSLESIGMYDKKPSYAYSPSSDVLVGNTNRIYLDVSVKSRETLEQDDTRQLITELLSLLPIEGSGSLPGILASSTKAKLFLAVKDDDSKTITVTEGIKVYNYKKDKNEFFQVVFDASCLLMEAFTADQRTS